MKCAKSKDCKNGRFCNAVGICSDVIIEFINIKFPHGFPPCTDEDVD